MKVSVTDEGVVVPKEMLEGIEDVIIRKKGDSVMLIPIDDEFSELKEDVNADYSFFKLGTDPIDDDITDASEKLDDYLYRKLSYPHHSS